MKYRSDLNLGEDLCIFTSFHFQDSGLYLLYVTVLTFNSICFGWSDTENPAICIFCLYVIIPSVVNPSSETQRQSVGSGEKAGRTFSSTGKRAPGYLLSPKYFQKFKRLPPLDWAQKMFCIIVPNRRTVSPAEFFS